MSLCDDLRHCVDQKHLETQCETDQKHTEVLAIVDWMERNIINAEPLPKFNLPALLGKREETRKIEDLGSHQYPTPPTDKGWKERSK